ncbi:MAG: DUF3365 domain-containing protein [Planctomycetes bacterium]|nr:DUF3365 domain-containing protein [Planctomycetota bacterium]
MISNRIKGLGAIVALYLGLIWSIWWQMDTFNTNIVTQSAKNTASSYIDLISSFRTLYTSEVIKNIPKNHVEISHDYDKKENAIPLPATLTIKLAELSRQSDGFDISLFSSHPFPWRKQRQLDEFSLRAIRLLKNNPQSPVSEVQDVKGRKVLRYAEADIMRASCIQCHNNHPDTPKNNWKVNDLRGVLAVTIPINDSAKSSSNALRDLLIIAIIIGFCTVLIVLKIFHNESLNLDSTDFK